MAARRPTIEALQQAAAINKVCKRCARPCKQLQHVVVVECRPYVRQSTTARSTS